MNNEVNNEVSIENNKDNKKQHKSKNKVIKYTAISVATVIIGLVAFNGLLPNKFSAMVNGIENTIHGLTGIGIDMNGDGVGGSTNSVKPVIYIYGAEDNQEVNVKILTDSEISCEYPTRDENDTWKVKADKDGTLHIDGLDYNYIYWEGINKFEPDFSTGFCVKGNETREFLENSLNELGLTRKEANEFIVYWLPILEANKYNLISFQTDRYINEYKLEVEPNTDNVLRVYIAYKPLENTIEIEKQDLAKIKGKFKRDGLYIVEWGGRLIN